MQGTPKNGWQTVFILLKFLKCLCVGEFCFILIFFQDDESYYAELWQNDMLAKKEREDKEAKIVAQRNMETSSVLKEQMQVLEKQKEEEKRLRIENARLAVCWTFFLVFFFFFETKENK
jgi:hypothetical protein